jgi:hypothetical protein
MRYVFLPVSLFLHVNLFCVIQSIPQTRSHYRNIVLGLSDLEDADLVWQDEWEVVSATGGAASPARSAKGKERDGLKGKKRESLAGRMSL